MLTSKHIEELPGASALIADLLRTGISVAFEAHGTSMLPTIHPGDKLLVTPAEEVKHGQVILMELARGLTAHRVVRVDSRGGDVVVVTRGDNASVDDPEIGIGSILGRVAAVTRGGRRVRLERRSRWSRVLSRLGQRVRSRLKLLVC